MNSYAILRRHGSILFDAPFRWTLDTIEELIGYECTPEALVLSHSDMAAAGDAFHEIREHYELPILMHPLDQVNKRASYLPFDLGDPTSGPGAAILARAKVLLIHIAGRTAGSVMLYCADDGGVLLAGDSAVGPGPEAASDVPLLQRPAGTEDDAAFARAWRAVVSRLPLAAVLPLHGAFCRRRDIGDDAFDASLDHMWQGDPANIDTR